MDKRRKTEAVCTGCGKRFRTDRALLWAREMRSDDPVIVLCDQCKIERAELDDEEFFDETIRGRA